VVSMLDGRVARDLVEKATTDLRTLFRKGEGWIPVVCLLGVVDMHDGIAMIAPLRLRTSDTTVSGGGRADLSTERLDLSIRAEGESPGLLALHVPLRISGRFDAPEITPTTSPARPNAAGAGALAPKLAQLAEHNPCRHERPGPSKAN
jgi:AsmA family protein